MMRMPMNVALLLLMFGPDWASLEADWLVVMLGLCALDPVVVRPWPAWLARSWFSRFPPASSRR